MPGLIRLAGDWAPRDRDVRVHPFRGVTLANLEGPVLDGVAAALQAPKAGPHLRHRHLPDGDGRYLFALANNHLMDYGEAGLAATLATCAARGFPHAGAGVNAVDAARPVFVEFDGIRFGMLSRCEVQFGIATADRPGVAAFDATIWRAIHDLKRECDLAIVSVHAAAEMSPWPSPARQDALRACVEAGADVVHGHHAHIPQGWEIHEGAPIFYGLGNFCVDPVRWANTPQALWSLVPELEWSAGKVVARMATSIIEDAGEHVRVRPAAAGESETHFLWLGRCNRPLADRALLEGLWQEVSIRLWKGQFGRWLQFDGAPRRAYRPRALAGAVLRRLRARFRSGRSAVGDPKSRDPARRRTNRYLLWHHLFACESHSSAIGTALGVLGGAVEDLRSSQTAELVSVMMPDFED